MSETVFVCIWVCVCVCVERSHIIQMKSTDVFPTTRLQPPARNEEGPSLVLLALSQENLCWNSLATLETTSL